MDYEIVEYKGQLSKYYFIYQIESTLNTEHCGVKLHTKSINLHCTATLSATDKHIRNMLFI